MPSARSRFHAALARTRALAARSRSLAGQHRLLAAVLAAGMAIRVLIEVAYRPALVFPDTIYYIHYATHFLRPGDIRTTLYSDAIAPFIPVHQLWLIPVAQHLLGLATAVLAYAVLIRWGCRKWLAAIAVIPLVLDPLELILEHYILSDTLSVSCMVAVLAVLTWHPGPVTRRTALWAGLLLAVSVLVRVQTAVLVVPVAAYLMATNRPWRLMFARGAAMAGALVVPLVGWMFWFHLTQGPWALSDYGGRWMYGRVAQFADCSGLALPAYERPLCPTQPVSQRVQDFYMWNHHSPQWKYHPPPGKKTGTVVGEFALRVIAHQPLTYARVVGVDYVYGFAPVRHTGPERYPEQYLQLQTSFPVFTWEDTGRVLWTYGHTGPEVQFAAARILRWYGTVYTTGPLLAASILVALAAAAGLGPARRSRLRPACLLFGLTALLLTVPDAAVSTFDWRYQLPQIVLAPVAGALGVAALIPRTRTTAGDRAATGPRASDEAADVGRDAVAVPD
jgi:hypothetical protein